MSRYKKNVGDFGESAAAEMLAKRGYYIMERQYHTKFGEIDIIALTPDKGAIVFVEVKTRKDAVYGRAALSVNSTKIRRIVKSAQQYLLDNPMEAEIRFDVIEVYMNCGNTRINHIENAFPDVSEYVDF